MLVVGELNVDLILDKLDKFPEVGKEVISRQMGYKVPPPEPLINSIGYQLMGSHQYNRAAYYFMMNVSNYPKSANVYDSMGDLLGAMQQKDTAIKCYQQALLLHESAETREKMEKLKR